MVHQTPGVGADVQLHPEMPLVPLLRLVHLRVAGVALVPGRRRRRDDGGVNDAALLQHPPPSQVIPDIPNSWCASPWRSGCRTAGRSARAASPTADAAVAPCRRPSDTPAQCGLPSAPKGSGRPSAPERSRGASCASCDRIRGWRRSIAEGAACQDPPKRRGARQRARTGCAMQRPKSGCIQRFPSHLALKQGSLHDGFRVGQRRSSRWRAVRDGRWRPWC